MAQTAKPVQLKPQTVGAFDEGFQEREGGVCVECRAISLTRDVPLGLGWIIEPIIQKLPQESLINTLEDTRQALHAEAK